jgi:predicted DNA-binding protein (MmcQ/YjbR family)
MHPPQSVAPKHRAAVTRLRAVALGHPQTREDHPWGESAFKVRDKVFLFMYSGETGLSLSVKLPESGDVALSLPFASPTGYGLGRSGWVTAKFAKREEPPVGLLLEWLEESFRAVAPKKLAVLHAAPPEPAKPKKAAKKKLRPKPKARGVRARSAQK